MVKRRHPPPAPRPVEDAPLLTMNCHEAWVHQLAGLPGRIDIVDGLPGRYTSRWDANVRPVPPNGRLLPLDEALRSGTRYRCAVAHNVTDLMDLKQLDAPRLLVIHTTMEGRLDQDRAATAPDVYLERLRRYVAALNIHVVAVSRLKGDSWGGLHHDVIPFGADVDVYPPWSGEVAAGIRVANQVRAKARVLRWELHEQAFADVPVRLVGHNPDMPGVAPSQSWSDLRSLLAAHRFYVHTAEPSMEDGYNMATLEAMAAGLPVLGNHHPTSPVVHGESGFLSDDPTELAGYARTLLADRELAGRMGEAARRTVRERFSVQRFIDAFAAAIATARRKWRGLPGAPRR